MNRPISSHVNQPRRTALFGAIAATAIAPFGLLASAATPRDDAALDLHIELRAAPDRVALRRGEPTRVWRYHGKLLRGDPNALEASAGSYLGPIIRVRRGQRVRIELINGLPESTITHWHGLHVPDDMDGHPRFAIGPGERYVYEFTVLNRAGTYGFHPHPHGRTGKQVYFGLAGLFLVSDDEEAALDLPTGEQDVPLVIQDRSFDDDNQLVYLNQGMETTAAKPRGGMMGGGGMMRGGMMGRGMGGTMTSMMGMFGDDILVNGRPDPSLRVERRAYRLRLLNASNSRIYKLAWSDGNPLTVIGNDGGLLAEPLQRDYVMLAPAERVDVWVDFARWRAGAEPVLRSLAFESGMAMGGMMMGSSALPDGAAFPVLRFRVGNGGNTAAPLPRRLSNVPPARPRGAVNFERPKVFNLTMRMMAWGINGRSFEVRTKLGADAGRVQGLFVTIDPERDTPEVLAKYVAAFDPSFLGLRTDAAATAALAKEFKVYFSADKADPNGHYMVDHMGAVYVFDPAGHLRLLMTSGTGVDAMAADVARLLKEKKT